MLLLGRADISGVAIHEFDPQLNEEQELVGPGEACFRTPTWSDILDPSTARVLPTYGKGYYAGQPAVTENNAEKGGVCYIGSESKSPFFSDRLIALAAKKTLVALNERIPQGVEVAVR